MRDRWIAMVAGGIAVIVLACGEVSHGEGPRHLNLPGRSDDRPFSHVVVAGDTIYVAGTLGLDAETGAPPPDPMDEARLALDGIKSKLELAGATMDDLVTVQVFCSEISLYEEFNAVYGTYFQERFPARAFVGSGPLLRGARFEIQGTAVKQ